MWISFTYRINEYNNKYLSKERTIEYCSLFLFSGGKMTKEELFDLSINQIELELSEQRNLYSED